VRGWLVGKQKVMKIKKYLLKIAPYFISILVGFIFYFIGLNLSENIRGLFTNLSAAFLAIPLIYLFYQVAQNLNWLDLTGREFVIDNKMFRLGFKANNGIQE
jgi:hypothetical protein